MHRRRSELGRNFNTISHSIHSKPGLFFLFLSQNGEDSATFNISNDTAEIIHTKQLLHEILSVSIAGTKPSSAMRIFLLLHETCPQRQVSRNTSYLDPITFIRLSISSP